MKKLFVLVPFLILTTLLYAEVWINEVYYDSEDSLESDVYTELKGTPGTSLDGYFLVGINGVDSTVYAEVDLSGYVIPSDSYFVIAKTNAVANYDMIDTLIDWQNGPDNVVLVYNDGASDQIIDAVGYGNFLTYYFAGLGNPTIDAPPGYSLSRRDYTGDNATDYMATNILTPGTSNEFPSYSTHTIYDIQYTTDDASPYVDSTVEITGVITGITDNGITAFISDGQGEWHGVMIYYINYGVEVGDSVTLIGTVSEYYNKTEIGDIIYVRKYGNVGEPTPTIVNIADIGEGYEGQFVRVEDVTVKSDSVGYNQWIVQDSNGDTLVVDDIFMVYKPNPTDSFAYIQGPIDYNYGEYKIEPRDSGDIVFDDSWVESVYKNIRIEKGINYLSVSTDRDYVVEIYSIDGRLMDKYYYTGDHVITIDNYKDGVYLYKVVSGKFNVSGKFIIVK